MSSSISTEFSDKFSESVSLKFESKTFDFDATESPFDQDDYSTASIEFDEQCDEQSSRDNELSKSEIETLEINLHSDSLANLIKLALETNTYLNHKTWREFFCQQIAEETVKKELNNEEFCEDNLFSLFSDTKKPIEEKHLYQYMKFLFRKEIIGLNHIPLKFRADRELILMALSFSSSAIAHVSHEHEDYLEFVHIAVDKFPETIKFVSSYCQDYAQIALRLVSNNGLLLQYITPEQQNMAMVLAAINQDNRALEFAKIPNFNEEMLASDLGQQFKEAVIACLESKGMRLQFVHPLLLRDKQVRLTAVRQDGKALEYIPEKYQDIATVLAAIEQNRGAIQWAKIPNFDEKMLASDLGQQFRQAVIACLKIDGSLLGSLLERLPPLLRTDMSVKFAAVYHTKDIRNIFTSAKDEEELAITIASHHPWNLVDEKLFRYQYNNKVLLAAALNKNRQCEIEIPKEIRDQLDKRLLDILKIKNYERRKAQCVAYYCATYNLTTMNEYTDTVLRQPILIQFMPDELFNDYEIVEEILQYDGSLIRFMPAHICDDLRYALMAVSITPDACMYLNDTIKNNNMIIHLATLPANQRATQFKLYIEALGKKSAHKDSYSSNSHTMFNSHCDNDSSNDTDGFIPSI
ncbi:MAG TPA: hypothetical protein DEO98_02360 [Legionellales bacterium]|nr:hypothetical protein [Legionellales bacterium]